MAQYKRKNIEDNAIGADKIALENNKYLKADNFAGDGFIDILRVKEDDTVEIPFYETIANVDSKDAATLASANSYTDSAVAGIPPVDLSQIESDIDDLEVLANANASDIDDLEILANANAADIDTLEADIVLKETIANVDSKDAATLAAANLYTDQKIAIEDARIDDLENRIANVQAHTGDFNAAPFKIHIVSGVALVKLPAPAINHTVTIKKTGSDFVTLEPHSTENIEGAAANYVLTSTRQSVTLVSDGTDWFII